MAESRESVNSGQRVRHPAFGLGRVSRVELGRAVVVFVSDQVERTVDASVLITRDQTPRLCGQCLRSTESCLADSEHVECCVVDGRINHQGDCYSNRRKAKLPYMRHGRVMKP